MKYMYKNIQFSRIDQSTKCRGITLLEVLLYIALFTIISGSTIYLYISLLNATDSFSFTIQKNEIQIYVRELVEYQLDTNQVVDAEVLKNSLERILKGYPIFGLVDIRVDYFRDEGVSLLKANSYVRIIYRLKQVHKTNLSTHILYVALF